jgi:hypothetical protein
MSGYWCADCDRVKPLFGDAESIELDLPRLGRVPFDPDLGGGAAVAGTDRPSRRAVREAAREILAALEAAR